MGAYISLTNALATFVSFNTAETAGEMETSRTINHSNSINLYDGPEVDSTTLISPSQCVSGHCLAGKLYNLH